jgi:choline dehydrogenase-like flavoprotein
MNYGYKTVPQEHCLDREIDYSRGRILGGSSAINFGVYTVGAKGDYDEWADTVGDATFSWDNMQRRLKALETFHPEVPKGAQRYVGARNADHGTSGPVHVGYAQQWEKDITPLIDVFEQVGHSLNLDHNSGNPIGISVMVNTAHKGQRSTAANALASAPENLTILTESPVQRLIIENKKVLGVESNGAQCM